MPSTRVMNEWIALAPGPGRTVRERSRNLPIRGIPSRPHETYTGGGGLGAAGGTASPGLSFRLLTRLTVERVASMATLAAPSIRSSVGRFRACRAMLAARSSTSAAIASRRSRSVSRQAAARSSRRRLVATSIRSRRMRPSRWRNQAIVDPTPPPRMATR